MNGGLLLYLKSCEVLGVGVRDNEVAAILQQRNRLAAALTHKQVCVCEREREREKVFVYVRE